jgi:hypothetical protein
MGKNGLTVHPPPARPTHPTHSCQQAPDAIRARTWRLEVRRPGFGRLSVLIRLRALANPRQRDRERPHGTKLKRPMSEEKRELLEKLKFELAFVDDGGYGRSVRTPHKPTSPFQDSLTCLNFGDPSRPHPCAECILMHYVPESRKGEDVPCHHIPLDQESRTIATLDATEAEEVLKRWLRHEISRLEGELAV